MYSIIKTQRDYINIPYNLKIIPSLQPGTSKGGSGCRIIIDPRSDIFEPGFFIIVHYFSDEITGRYGLAFSFPGISCLVTDWSRILTKKGCDGSMHLVPVRDYTPDEWGVPASSSRICWSRFSWNLMLVSMLLIARVISSETRSLVSLML